MTEPPDKGFYKTVKVPLKHIVKHPDINQPKINNLVFMTNKIVIHTLQFMKLYLLNYYNINNKLPTIDSKFINCCMKIICKEKASGRPAKAEIQELKNTLIEFYNKHYKNIQVDELEYTHMNTILDYMTISILTDYENNIKFHYVEYLERYINVVWKKKFIIEKIRKIKKTKKERDSSINSLISDLRKIKLDLLNVENENFVSKPFYHKWIKEQKKLILPTKTFKKSNLHYDIQCEPMHYLPCMIYMMKKIDNEGLTTYNPFPLRSDIIPKHIRIDTTTLVHTLLTKKQGNKSEYLFNGNLKKNEYKIWSFFFRTERKCFNKHNYSFHHMIETDGISASILLINKNKIGKRQVNSCNTSGEKYIDELDIKTYNSIKNKKIVAIDPGKCDLIYCVDGDNKECNEFRYSQNQRRKETKQKKYSKLILKEKETKIKGKTIIEYETELSKFNKKTLNITKFKEYLKEKNKVNNLIMKFYSKTLFRKLKLNGYINRKRSEQKLINNFIKKFGNKEDIIVCFGDFEQKKHMKYKEPIKGKGIRTLFRNNGITTYLVDEFRTSCKCSKCGCDNEKFKVMPNPKPYRKGNILIHGLLKCKSCSGVWNRDVNGATNIYKIAKNSINRVERPSYLCRSSRL